MTVKRRIRNKYRIELRERDHESPHVHLTGGGFDVLILLDTLESVGQWPLDAQAEALEWIAAHRDELLEEWRRWHP